MSLRGRDLVSGTEITLEFDRDAVWGGTSGCNSYGSFVVRAESGAIDIGADTLTTIGCRGPVGRQESVYLEALDASRTYRVEGDRLKLRDQSTRTILIFEKETE